MVFAGMVVGRVCVGLFFNVRRNLGTKVARQKYVATRNKIQSFYCLLCSFLSTLEEEVVCFACFSNNNNPCACKSYRFDSTASCGVLSSLWSPIFLT